MKLLKKLKEFFFGPEKVKEKSIGYLDIFHAPTSIIPLAVRPPIKTRKINPSSAPKKPAKKVLVAKPKKTSKPAQSTPVNYIEDNNVIIIHDGTPDYLALLALQGLESGTKSAESNLELEASEPQNNHSDSYSTPDAGTPADSPSGSNSGCSTPSSCSSASSCSSSSSCGSSSSD